MQLLESIGKFGADLIMTYTLAATVIFGFLTLAISAHAAWKISRIK